MNTETLLLNAGLRDILKKLLHSIESGLADEFLDLLLKGMEVVFFLDKDFRRNIENFTASYFFTSNDGKICVSAIFEKGKMSVHKHACKNPTLKITFKDAKALMHFLISSGSDLLTPLLHQDVVCDGNLNYLSKFGYMSKHLMLMIHKL